MLQMWNAGTKRIMKDIPEEYKKRWRIENNFKSVEQISMCALFKGFRDFCVFVYSVC